MQHQGHAAHGPSCVVLGIPCRFHGFTIDKRLQRGVVPELVYPLAPANIIHSWVEIQHEGQWLELEGFILDAPVLAALQGAFPDRNSLCAYGAGTNCLQNPDVAWRGASTYIQKTGINHDFGTFDDPDAFYENHRQLSGVKGVFVSPDRASLDEPPRQENADRPCPNDPRGRGEPCSGSINLSNAGGDLMAGCCGHDAKFDGVSDDYKRRLWIVIALNATMFVVEMTAGHVAKSQALQADALDFAGDAMTYGISLAVIGASLRARTNAALFKGFSLC